MTPTIDDLLPLPADPNELPDPLPFYTVATRDGYMLHKRTLLGKVLVPVNEASHLPSTGPLLWKNIPRIPAEFMGRVLSFFRAIYDRYSSEVIVYLTYKAGQYRVFVPPQDGSGAHVNCDLDGTKLEDGWALIGTIHSHCGMPAFHSGTDRADAAKHDGLHITIGNVDVTNPSIAAMAAFNGQLWDLKEEDYLEQPGWVTAEHPKWWERYVNRPLRPRQSKTTSVVTWHQPKWHDDPDRDYKAWSSYRPARDFGEVIGLAHVETRRGDLDSAGVLDLVHDMLDDGRLQPELVGYQSDLDVLAEAEVIEQDLQSLADSLAVLGITLTWDLTTE